MKKFPAQLALSIGLLVLFTHTANANWVQINSPLVGRIYALAVSGNDIFAGTWGGGVFVSTNSCTSWTAVNYGLTNLNIMSLAVSGGKIFTGTYIGGVSLSTDTGTTWTGIGLKDILNITALAVSNSNIFAGTAYNGVFLSTNNGASWTAVNSGITSTGVTSLAVSGGNIFAGNSGGVFLSANNGTSWTAIGLANTGVMFFTVSGGNIFAGANDSRIFLSANNGASWAMVDSGLMNLDVRCLAVSGGNMLAGTYGGMLWRRPLSELTGVINHKPQREILKQDIFKIRSPSHADKNLTIELSLRQPDLVTIKIYDLSGRKIATLVNKYFGSGLNSLSWDGRNIASGCFTVIMQAGSNTYIKNIPILR